MQQVRTSPSTKPAAAETGNFVVWPQQRIIAQHGAHEEAAAIANRMVQPAADSFLQRKCTECSDAEVKISREALNDPTVPARQPKAETIAEGGGHFSAMIQQTKGRGQPMDSRTQSFMSSRFEKDFSGVRIHTNDEAAGMSESLQAKAFTTGRDIYFNNGQYEPGSEAGKRLLAHELTHVVQQEKSGGTFTIRRQALPSSLAGYPEIDRRRIQVSWQSVTPTLLPAMAGAFGTTPATAGIAVSHNTPHGTIVFSPNIPTSPSSPSGFDVRHGLKNIAHHLQSNTSVLPLNATISLTLNLTLYGGANADYRFTYFEHASGTGANVTLTQVTLIEQLRTATGLPAVTDQANAAPSGNFTHRGATFTLGSGWSNQQRAILDQALALVPANGITQLTGVSFALANSCTGEEGHYDEPTHTITICRSAFSNRLNAYAGGTDAVRIIVHEIAHAIDRRAVRLAWDAYTAGGQTPAGKRTLEATRSLSGSSYVFDTGANQHVLQEGTATTAFRNAVIADRTQQGVTLPGGISPYSTTNWEENFAEAFAFYMADRILFQQLRPNTFQYFQQRYP